MGIKNLIAEIGRQGISYKEMLGTLIALLTLYGGILILYLRTSLASVRELVGQGTQVTLRKMEDLENYIKDVDVRTNERIRNIEVRFNNHVDCAHVAVLQRKRTKK